FLRQIGHQVKCKYVQRFLNRGMLLMTSAFCLLSWSLAIGVNLFYDTLSLKMKMSHKFFWIIVTLVVSFICVLPNACGSAVARFAKKEKQSRGIGI
ncbi:MAG: hypothetical protein O7A06_01215, partial [Acidobacteria bacterium]|nr:hypothetical protein [Acidobacteriota bacterium]